MLTTKTRRWGLVIINKDSKPCSYASRGLEAYGLIRLMFSPSNPFRGPQPQKEFPERDTYLPPGIKRAMNQYSQEVQGQSDSEIPGLPAHPQVVAPSGQDQPPGFAQPGNPAATHPSVQAAAADPDQAYDFITDPPKTPKESLFTKITAGSLVSRIALAIAILIFFIIIISIFKNIAGRSSTAEAAALTTVVQDQQELIHIAGESSTQAGLAANHQNFTATLQLSVGSSQGQLINYLLAGKKKLTPQQLNLKVSSTIDSQLSAAVTANDFDQVFQQVMQSQLSSYYKDIQKAYAQDKGPHARAILQDSSQQAQLLYTQLTSQASS